MANQRIDIDVGLKVDKTGLNQIKSSLQEIKNLTAQDLMKIGGHTDIQKAERELQSLKTSISQIDGALERAFNTDLGTLNVSKFNQALKGMNLNKVYQDFSAAGSAGQAAFRNVTSQILTTNMQLKQTHNFLNNMATTMANTVKWGVASSVMNNFTGSVRKAYGYVKSLDTSLNDIRIVTGKSADEMERFATKANNAAKELGKSTTDYTKASLIYYQQGLSDKDVAARAETTLKAANVTGQSGEAVSEQLTAVWNGYKVSAEEAELYVDKLAAVAATTASNLEELSTGMSKVASAANLMGVDADQLNAQLSTIISVTRQAPESVGTALKTIYARMGDIEAGLDTETTLGSYTEDMKEMGINVLDANGKLRDMGSVIEEIGGKWSSMTREQQLSLAQTAAGTRQYNNLLALFDNWDSYTKALETSRNAAGTLQEQQDTYMESTRAHLNQLKAASEDLYDSLLDPKGINPVIDGLTTITNLMSNFVDSIGGGGNILLALGSIGTKVFSQQLASGIATFITNLQNAKDNAAQLRAELEIAQKYQNSNINDSQIKTLVDMKKQVLDLDKSITNEERNIANEYINQQNELYKQQDALKQKVQEAQKLYENLTGATISVDPNTGKGAATLGKELLKEAGDFEQYTNKANITRKAILELTAARRQFEEARGKTIGWDAEAKDFQPYQQAIDKTKQKIQEYINTVASLQNKGKLSPQGIEDVNNSYEKLKNVVGDVNQIQLSNGKHVAALKTYYEETSSTIQKTGSSIISLGRDMEVLESQLSDNKKYITELQQSYTNFLNGIDLRAKIQQNLQLVSSFGQLASAMTSIGNMGSIWSNESLSTGEKMLQTVTNLGFALPMLANSLGKILPLETAIGAARQKQIATLVARNGIEASYNLAVKTGLPPQLALIAAQEKKNGNTAFYNRLLRIQKKLIAGKNLTEGQQIFLDEALAKGQQKVGISALFAAGGLKAFWGALGLMGQLTVIALGIVAVAKVFDWLTVSAKEAGENLEKSIESFNNTKSELESLESELQTTKERMEELLSLDELSITDKQELAELEKQNAQLEVQIELLKQKQKLESQQIARDARIAAERGTYNKETTEKPFTSQMGLAADSGKEIEGVSNVYYGRQGMNLDTSNFNIQKNQIDVTDQSTFDSWKNDMQGLLKEALQNVENTTGFEKKSWEKIASKLEKDIQKTEDEYQKTQAENAEALEEGYLKGQEALPHLRENNINGVNDAAIAQYEDITRRYYESLGTFDSLVTGTMDEFLSMDEQANLISAGEINSEKELQDVVGEDTFSQMQEYAELLGVSIFDIVERFQTMYGDLSELDTEALKEKFKTEKIEDITTSFNEGLDEGETQLQASDLEGLNNEQLSNWEALVPYIEEAYKQTGNYKEAIAEAVKEQEKDLDIQRAKEVADEGAEKYDLDSEEIQDHAEHLQDIAKESDKVSDSLENQAEAAAETAVAHKRLNKGLDTLQENFEDQKKILKKGNKESEEYTKAMEGIKDALGDVLNIDGGNLTDGFVEENLKDIEAAANGDVEAIERLRNAAAQDILCQVMGVSDFSELNADMQNLHNQISSFAANNNLKIGATVDNTQFIAACNQMISAAGMTATEASNYFKAMGYDANLKTVTKTIPGKTETYTETGEAFAGVDPDGNAKMVPISTKVTKKWPSQEVQVPVVETLTYTGSAGGSVNFSNTKAGGASTGNSGGGGGGGKGGGSTPKKTYKQTEKKKDRYHDVNNELSKLATNLEKLNEQQERLFGSDLLKNLNKQLKVIEKQVSKTKEKLDLAKAEAKEMREQSKANQEPGYYNDLLDFGVKFNDNGEITNALSLMEKWDDKVKELHDKWNNMSAKNQEGEAGEKLEEEIAKAEANRDMLHSLIEGYDELIYDTIPGLESEIQEQASLQIEIKLAKFKLEAELRLDLTEAYEQWYDFKQELLDFNMFEDYTEVSGLLSTEAKKLVESAGLFKQEFEDLTTSGLAETLTDDVNDLTKEIKDMRENPTTYNGRFAAHDKDGNVLMEDGKVVINEQAVIDAWDEAVENLEDHLVNVKEVQQQLFENLLESIDLIQESYEQQFETLEFVGDQIDYNLSMMELLGGENYAKMADYYAAAADNAKEMTIQAEEAMSYYETQMQRQDITEEEREKFRELYMDAANTFQDALAAEAEIVQAQFENTVKQQAKAIRDALGTDKAEMKWQLEMDKEDDYLDAVNAAFGRQSFINKVQENLDKTDSLSAQRKLNDLLDDELKKLEKKDKLTQYDVDRANQMLEIELKRIALEEAQQNKSKMRLRRDSSGNYSYQFVADEEAQTQAQQELADAQNSLYNMDKEELQNKNQEILDAARELEESMLEYASLGAEQRALLQDEYYAKWEYLKERQQELAGETEFIQVNLAQSTYDSMKTLYDQDAANFTNLTDKQKELLNSKHKTYEELSLAEQTIVNTQMKPTWESALEDMKKAIRDEEDPKKGLEGAFNTAATNIQNATSACADKLEALRLKAEEVYQAVAVGKDGKKPYADQWLEKQKLQTQEIINTTTEIRALKTAVDTLAQSWQTVFDNAMDALEKAQEYKEYITKLEADEVGGKTTTSTKTTTKSSTTTKTTTKSTTTKKNKLTADIIDGIAGAIWYWSPAAWGTGDTRKKRINEKFGSGAYDKVQSYINDHVSGSKLKKKFDHSDNYSKYKDYYYSKFDTGGYTGNWSGKDGKMAMLHQKELVLNAKDTENILATVNIVRDMQGMINSLNDALSARMSAMLNSVNASNSLFDINSGADLNQHVSIEANFPNVSSRNEIEKAFENLVNMASQHAFNTRK